MVTPSSTYDYNMDTGEKTLMKQNEVVGGYDSDRYYSYRPINTIVTFSFPQGPIKTHIPGLTPGNV